VSGLTGQYSDRSKNMGKRAKASNKFGSISVRKKPLLVRVKILNASRAENIKVRGLIDEALSDEIKRIDVEFED
jgi:hypothetical protein